MPTGNSVSAKYPSKCNEADTGILQSPILGSEPNWQKKGLGGVAALLWLCSGADISC